ncbi:MAG: chromosome segregation protein SMC [Gemmatimonadota bacterium]
MKLRALRLHGFKSFADRTEIVFHDGITAIVGPNGCGKSNISDAIRWVLGEQRPSAIRGGKMEEAIFQGTVHRRPVNRGSVSMEVSNADGSLPVPYSEVEISRTVYRDGGSEYGLNRSACRLRDIQDLCRDTGLGANAYAVIENRMIDAILSDRAEERRGLFEEAASIGKYKDRRRAASRRLERAEVDLQRLEDLIGEVQSKVRSLARQKGKAERHSELRARRLNLEVTLARAQLEEFGARLEEIRGLLTGDLARDEGLKARVGTVEARLESLRAEQVAAEKARTEVAGRVEEVRTELVRWEREIAVAQERETYAERRLGQIDGERAEARARIQVAEARARELVEQRKTLESGLEGLSDRIDAQGKETREVRADLLEAREGLDEVEGREREVARRVAQLQGDAEAAEGRGTELEERIRTLANELQQARDALGEAASQGDLFTDRVGALEEEVDAERERLVSRRARVDEARAAFERAREAEIEAQDRFGALAARRDALARLESDREGVDPAVQALLRDPPDGVLGILADFLATPPKHSGTVEAVLGVYLRAVVVRDAAVARRLAEWFQDDWKGSGGLILLPLDRVPRVQQDGGLLGQVSVTGEGTPWVRALLQGVEIVDADTEAGSGVADRDGARVASNGAWVDRNGVFTLGNPFGSTGILERKEQLRTLEEEVGRAEEAATAAHRDREVARERVDAAERSLEEVRAGVREAEDAHREARAEQAERTDRLVRMERTVTELETQVESNRGGLARARERAAEARREREELLSEEQGLREERAEARERLDTIQDLWDEVRAEESRLSVERARLEGEASRLEERERELESARKAAEERVQALGEEQGGLSAEREKSARLREEGAAETERLFEVRDEAEEALREKDRTLADLHESVAGAERSVREARNAERAAAEERHRLELEAQEVRGRLSRVQDRLEGEWGRSLERLLEEAGEVEGTEAELRSELREVVEGLDRIGPVNMLAVEEHEEENARLAFLSEQRDDLVEARNDLGSAIREINETATALFTETFEAIRTNFQETFRRLFEGGECDLWLEDPDDPLESAIEIHAAPRGKRTQSIDLLSGGERALTALSLLFGIYLVKPSPFCVLDEVDAPLDESNIGRFIRLLQEFKLRTQFVVITHNPRTIEAADWIYGVTMEEAGVSTIVGVRLDQALETAAL